MGKIRTLKLISFSIALAMPAGALLAAAGGGSSSSAPSMSAPEYDPAAEYRNGIAALQANRFADAKRAFSRVLSVAPNDANSNYLAGLADAGLNDHKSARKHYEKAVKADKDMVLAHRELALTYIKL